MNYTADDIKIVSWPEPIRNRPGMYLDPLGKLGCIALIEEVLVTILDKKYGCAAEQVELRYTRHDEIIIEYSGSGMPVESSKIDGIIQPTIYRAMMSLSCGAFEAKDFLRYGHLAEIGPIFNAACRVLRLTSVSAGKSYSLSFFKGCLSSLLSESSSTAELNSMRFVFDPEVMGDFELSAIDLEKIADNTLDKFENVRICYRS